MAEFPPNMPQYMHIRKWNKALDLIKVAWKYIYLFIVEPEN